MQHVAVEALAELSAAELEVALGGLSAEERRALDEHWPAWVHEGQLPPPSASDWRVWVLLAGRGFGKTRAGAEYVSEFARTHADASIALVAATAEEARAVMIEGPRSGLLAVARSDERGAMRWEPSRRRLTFASGAKAFVYSAANPESLRGPEHHIAWCDELAKWTRRTRSGEARGEAAWHNLQLGLRLGERPRTLVTTTPRGVPALKRILAGSATVTSGGPSWANPQLPPEALDALVAEHGGTRFGRQELEGLLIEDVDGALWPRALIERCRADPHPDPLPRAGEGAYRRVVIGVDPPGSAQGDACGMVVCGLGADGVAYVLADLSVAGLSPEGWARRVAAASEAWGAHRVVAEKNNGGEMVEAVLRGADAGLPVTLVHAADGKAARAEPVAVRFESGKAKLAGRFPELEDELAGFTYEGFAGAGSPDRADAMIWAMTELLVKPQRAEPRVRRL